MSAPDIKTALPGPKARALIERDAKVVSPSYTRGYPLVIDRASGCEVLDVDGNVFLDCAAGIAVNSTGHSHPEVVKAMHDQAQRFLHMSGTDFYYEPQVRLGEELAAVAPMQGGVKSFFGNSGTEAIEASLKGGTDLVAIANPPPGTGFWLYAPPQVRSLEDLRGKIVGANQVGTSTYYAVDYAFRERGMVAGRDYEILSVGNQAAQLAALEQGTVQAGVYSAVTHYLNAIKEAGSDDAKTVVAQMKATPVNDFFAKDGKIRADGRMVHDMYLARVKTPDESSGPWDYYEILRTIPGDQAFLPLEQSTCPLVTQ